MKDEKLQGGETLPAFLQNLEPLHEKELEEYAIANNQININEITEILITECQRILKNKEGVYIEKQIPVPIELLPFIP